ncbi:putative vesicle-associated membrane protein 726 [Panicum virgatum]|nr:putative vesicle-associated membrane protein 726 [Panicum virgatum]
MGQQRTLIYSFVARGTTVLADHAEVSGNFASVAAQCLQKLPSNNNRFNYNCDGHTFNYHIHDGFTYCVVATESSGRQLPIGFIERVKEDFSKKYSGGKARTANANGLKREYGPKLKEHMRYCDQHPEEIDKLAKVKAQVTEVKGVMMQNIEKVLDRGEKIELLVDKTEDLRSQAQDFRQQGTKIRRKMWWENMKMKLIVFGIVVALILLIVLTVCKDFNCW